MRNRYHLVIADLVRPFPCSNPGCCVHAKRSPVFDDLGRLSLKVSGYTDTQNMINSHLEECDMHLIIQSLNRGDSSVINVHPVSYGDQSVVPRSPADLLNQLNASRETFEKLPLETRQKFDFSFEKWLSSAGSPDWIKNMFISAPADPALVDPVPVSREVNS